MESTTKTKVEEDKIRELVKRNFGSRAEVDQITPLDGGMMNAVYLLTYKEAVQGWKEMILKLSFVTGSAASWTLRGPFKGIPMRTLFPRTMSQVVVLARPVGECREGQIPKCPKDTFCSAALQA